MLPDLSRLALRGAPTDGIVVLEEDDRRRFDDDAHEKPRLDSLDLEPIPANVPLFEMPVDPNRPEGVMDYFNPATVWRAALANPLKAPLRPLLREEWEELKANYGDAASASDEDKKRMQRAEHCLERYWASEPGEEVVCGPRDGRVPDDAEDGGVAPRRPEERFAYMLAAGDPAVVAAGSLEKLNEWNDWVTTPNVPAEARPSFEEQTKLRIENDARERGTFPDAWPHPAMLREVHEAILWIMDSLLSDDEDDEGEEEGEEEEDESEPDDPDDPEAWYDLQVDDDNFVADSFDGWEDFLRATWRLLPGLPESAVNGAVVRAVLDAAQASRIYNAVVDTYNDEEIVDTVRELLNDLITRFPYLWEHVYSMAETDAQRLDVAETAMRAASEAERSEESWAEVMKVRRDRLRGEAGAAGAAGAAGPSSSSDAGPSLSSGTRRFRARSPTTQGRLLNPNLEPEDDSGYDPTDPESPTSPESQRRRRS
jgi:hypothetical protein